MMVMMVKIYIISFISKHHQMMVKIYIRMPVDLELPESEDTGQPTKIVDCLLHTRGSST